MSEGYVEIMVKKETSPWIKILSYASCICSILCILLAVMGLWAAAVPAAVTAVSWYVLRLYHVVEYEYLYVDKELTIDRILGRSKRKRMETIEMGNLELMAPFGSHELSKVKKEARKTWDYSSGKKDKGSVYVMVTSEKEIYLEPNEEMVKMIKMSSPRKVFTY